MLFFDHSRYNPTSGLCLCSSLHLDCSSDICMLFLLILLGFWPNTNSPMRSSLYKIEAFPNFPQNIPLSILNCQIWHFILTRLFICLSLLPPAKCKLHENLGYFVTALPPVPRRTVLICSGQSVNIGINNWILCI